MPVQSVAQLITSINPCSEGGVFMETLSSQLIDKLRDEYTEYCQELLNREKQEIFDRHYETTVKYELLCEISAHENYFDFLSTAVQANLLSMPGLLDMLYERWLKHDSSIGTFVSEVIQGDLQYTSFFAISEEKNAFSR